MSTKEFTEVPHTIGCKISQGILCQRWLQSDGAIFNRRAINHSNMSILEGLAPLIGSHMAREPTASPVLTKWWNWKLMLATKFGSLCTEVISFGSQNFGSQIWFCARLLRSLVTIFFFFIYLKSVTISIIVCRHLGRKKCLICMRQGVQKKIDFSSWWWHINCLATAFKHVLTSQYVIHWMKCSEKNVPALSSVLSSNKWQYFICNNCQYIDFIASFERPNRNLPSW